MSGLLRAELRRWRWRRAILWFQVAAAALPLLLAAVLLWQFRPVTDADRARAEATAASEAQQPYFQRDLMRCEKRPDRYGVEDAGACREALLPRPEWYLDREPLDLVEVSDSGLAVVVLVLLAAVLAGTTFAGHDWATRSMTNQLLAEPRRVRVWEAKAVVVTVTSAVLGAVVLTLYWCVLGAVASTWDSATTSGSLSIARDQVVCGAALAGFGALGGFGLTMLLRSSLGALGVLVAFTAVVPLAVAISGIDVEQRWFAHANVAAVVLDGFEYYDPATECFDDMSASGPGRGGPEVECDPYVTVTRAHGAGYLGVLTALVCVPSLLSFRRRDVP